MEAQPQETDKLDDIKNIVEGDHYSLDMIDTMFADSLSRGMQNAIISQQNAQMVSSSSITNACARILQSKSHPQPSSGNATTTASTGTTTGPGPEKQTPSFLSSLGRFLNRNKKLLLALVLIPLLSWGAYEIITRLNISTSISMNFDGQNSTQAPEQSQPASQSKAPSESPEKAQPEVQSKAQPEPKPQTKSQPESPSK